MTDRTQNSMPICPLCFSEKAHKYFYPPTKFNGKIFDYLECDSCNCTYVIPFPEQEDFDVIYGENDHAYLKRLKDDEMISYDFNYPLYNHQGYQINFFRKWEYWKNANTLLDIGCGSGFYMKHAQNFGMNVTGIEYDAEFAKLLRKKSGLDIYSFSDFEERFKGKKFDLIHMGHLMEHLIKPHEILDWISEYAHDNTILIVDGPLEKNTSFSRFVISMGSRIKKNPMNEYAPQHITFTDKNSQLRFFERNNLHTVRMNLAEQLFPFPSKPDFKSPRNFILYFIGIFSVTLSKLIPNRGNVFHYAGKFRK